MEDLRTPIGILFLVLGGLLLTQTQAHAALASGTVNLSTGAAMIVFGLGMLGLAFRGRKDRD